MGRLTKKKQTQDLSKIPEVVSAVQNVKRVNNVLELWRQGKATDEDVAKALDEGEEAANAAIAKLKELHK